MCVLVCVCESNRYKEQNKDYACLFHTLAIQLRTSYSSQIKHIKCLLRRYADSEPNTPIEIGMLSMDERRELILTHTECKQQIQPCDTMRCVWPSRIMERKSYRPKESGLCASSEMSES